jgi:hypothetical protein
MYRLPEEPHSGPPIARCTIAWMPASARRWQSSAASGSFAAVATTSSSSATRESLPEPGATDTFEARQIWPNSPKLLPKFGLSRLPRDSGCDSPTRAESARIRTRLWRNAGGPYEHERMIPQASGAPRNEARPNAHWMPPDSPRAAPLTFPLGLEKSVCDPTGASSVEERPAGDQERARADIPFAVQARSVGLIAVAAAHCADRRERAAMLRRQQPMEAT